MIIGCILFLILSFDNDSDINVPDSAGVSIWDNPARSNEDISEPDSPVRELILVNSSNPVPADYKPDLTEVTAGEYLDKLAAEPLLKMLSDAKAAGLEPIICSAYRDEDFQRELFENQVDTQKHTGLSYEHAVEEAKKVVAYPGTSEHQLGLAVDIVAESYQPLDDAQAETEEAKWLKENCWKYGFILRYPPDKTDITGIIFEPWHYRYVGVDAATNIMKEGLCLEEYIELYS